jgi:hypothetical protein
MFFNRDTERAILPLQRKLLDELRDIAQEEGRSLKEQIRFFLANAVTRNNTKQHGDKE